MAAPQKSRMSLYANLLDTNADSSGSISRAPVLFKQEDADKDPSARKPIDPGTDPVGPLRPPPVPQELSLTFIALRFQPIRRPQAKQAKPKPAFSKGPPAPAPTTSNLPAPTSQAAPAPQRSTLADWAPTEEDEWLYSNVEKRPRGGRRKKKRKDDGGAPAETDWDELYDPARPTNVEEYLRSDERVREVREWKAVLYAHRRRRRASSESDYRSDEEEERTGLGSESSLQSDLHPRVERKANVVVLQISSLLQINTPSHLRPCPQLETRMLQPQATMPTPAGWPCPAAFLPQPRRQVRRLLHLQKINRNLRGAAPPSRGLLYGIDRHQNVRLAITWI